MRRHGLQDNTTCRIAVGALQSLTSTGIPALATVSECQRILVYFTKPCNLQAPPEHDVTQHILTTRPPIMARPRCLSGERLYIALKEFDHLLHVGIIRPSSSSLASPLHLAPETELGGWQPCGDYQVFNTETAYNSCTLSHVHDFTASVAGATIFAKIELVKVRHHMPEEPANISKTSITTPSGLCEYV